MITVNRVKCIDAEESFGKLVKGKIYTVGKVTTTSRLSCLGAITQTWFELWETPEDLWFANRFKKVGEWKYDDEAEVEK